ncbi:hypothetical protein P691DRAFT_389258 [Macrolepiota fuliginosa MF-IS2]|uniref:Uncharacterized protein n=1 Tax=Macrolepiota fuliginosa MF-IS2 TaxID=1400762 RepID=A0A9P5X5T0_9AGAR|nr:hypothetical protein P691DRAFT_389258 [Macrolepiota fuliginosa MF-IS2]
MKREVRLVLCTPLVVCADRSATSTANSGHELSCTPDIIQIVQTPCPGGYRVPHQLIDSSS